MRGAWGDASGRNLEEIEIIDLKDRETLQETWRGFTHTNHWGDFEAYARSLASILDDPAKHFGR
jgi:hypothetical protein